MNLPPELRYRPENLFFAGIMPPPFQPDVVTISNLIDPLVEQLIGLFSGKAMKTAHHPDGVTVRVAILPIVGDLPAIRKLCGYVAPTADFLCSYCPTLHAEIDDDLGGVGYLRQPNDVRNAAARWKQATTIAKRNTITTQTGVRWSPLHKLSYWDPVKSPVIGFMHNIVEGVLVHHLRVLWGIGAPDSLVKAHKEALVEDHESLDGYDPSEYDSELEGLAQEFSESGDSLPSHPRRGRSASSSTDDDDMMVDDGDHPPPTSESSNTPSTSHHGTPVPDAPSAADASTSSGATERADPDYEDLGIPELCIFSDDKLGEIRQCIQNVALPTWVSRPPHNLGEASHGKLKADTVLLLFTVILPMIVPEILSRTPDRRRSALLKKFAHLVAATHIVSSYSTSDALADQYTSHYVRYRQTRHQLWPAQHSLPNHHIAAHNGEALKFWGPLAPLSEFPYERQNGVLAAISTNNHLCKP
ncbi:hypothetical protein AURDEDRAFT_125337 [Auricularia subglabra TFB-10046 SS5]|nr:hypothetical protein AURDEDRAFT_125337 [Auricularia subglabra TFB-10046 SS5]